MNRTVHPIITAIFLLLAGALLGHWLCSCGTGSEVSDILGETEKTIELQRDSIRMYEKKLAYLQQNNLILQKSLDKKNREHTEIRRSPIPPAKIDSLEVTVIDRGIVHFGNSPNQDRRAKVASYGAQAFDNLEVSVKQNANQKAQIIAYKGIVKHQDTIIGTQEVTIRKIVQASKKERNKGRKEGLLAGAGIAAFLFLILK